MIPIILGTLPLRITASVSHFEQPYITLNLPLNNTFLTDSYYTEIKVHIFYKTENITNPKTLRIQPAATIFFSILFEQDSAREARVCGAKTS